MLALKKAFGLIMGGQRLVDVKGQGKCTGAAKKDKDKWLQLSVLHGYNLIAN